MTSAPRPLPSMGLLARLRLAASLRHEEAKEPGRSSFSAAWVPPDWIQRRADLAYGTHPAQVLDLYLPAQPRQAPVLLYVHGGGWRRGDKAMRRMVAHKVTHWVGQGCIVASANYRMLPEADVLSQADDIGLALAFLQAQSGRWGGDASRLALVGHSAGAHLVALLTADPSVAAAHGTMPWRATVALDSAALDMVTVMTRPHYRFYDPVFGDDPAFWRRASPLHRLCGAPVAPMLMVCSQARDDSAAQSEAFAERANHLGGRVSVLRVPLDHAQINDELGQPGVLTTAVDEFLSATEVL